MQGFSIMPLARVQGFARPPMQKNLLTFPKYAKNHTWQKQVSVVLTLTLSVIPTLSPARLALGVTTTLSPTAGAPAKPQTCSIGSISQ